MAERVCVNCGATVPATFERLCNKCWEPWDVRRWRTEAEPAETPEDGSGPRICVNCGATVPPDFEKLCNKCWQPWRQPMRATILEQATQQWMLPLVPRTYRDTEKGRARLLVESKIMTDHGYEASLQTQDGGHIHVGRLLLTGGWSVLAGQKGIRSKGSMTITFTRPPDRAEERPLTTAKPDPVELIKKLGELRDAGLLSSEEFEAKKADLLSRM